MSTRRRGALILAVTVAVTLSVWGFSDRADPKPEMTAVAPGGVLDRSDVPDALIVRYEEAAAHPDVFAAVPCFCGCSAALSHRHLLDCFVRPDGSGWEAHAAGCGVCLGEAAQVSGLLAAGVGTDGIRAAVIAEWGDPYSDDRMES